jgi:hypothetical protein
MKVIENFYNLSENNINELLDNCTAKEIELFMVFMNKVINDSVLWYTRDKVNRTNINLVQQKKIVLKVIYEFEAKRRRLL